MTVRHRILLLSPLLLATLIVAKEDGLRDIERRFRADFAEGAALDVRQRAVEGLGVCGHPGAIALLHRALGGTWARLDGLVVRTEAAREDLDRFEVPLRKDMTRAERRSRARGGPINHGLPESVRARWSELQRAVMEAAARETAERDLVDRIVRSIGRLLDSLPDSDGQTALMSYLAAIREERDVSRRATMIRALGSVGKSRAEDALVYLLVTDAEPRVQVAAAGGLGELRSARGLDTLVDRLRHPVWPVRAAAAEALGRIGPAAAEAVVPLVEMLEREAGRLREDAAAALEKITGRELGPIAGRWRAWLEARQRGEDGLESDDPEENVAEGATFYGIRTLSRRLLFVLDRSGSMRSPANPADPDRGRTKLALMKRELRQAVTALDEGARFNVIVYHHSMARLDERRSQVVVGEGTGAVLDRFLAMLDPIGATNIHDALEQAFTMAGIGVGDEHYEPGFDTIFFLTDGNPTAGKIRDPEHIRSEVRRWNALRRIRIHVVAVGNDVNQEFLRGLAEDAGGQYIRR